MTTDSGKDTGYAQASVEASFNASGREGGPFNWDIDAEQEKQIEKWAKAAKLWVEDSEQIQIIVMKK